MQPTGISLPGPLQCVSFLDLKRLVSSFFFFGFVFVVGMIGGARTLHKACWVLSLCSIFFFILSFSPSPFFFHWCATCSHTDVTTFFFCNNWNDVCVVGTGGHERNAVKGWCMADCRQMLFIFFPSVEILLCSPLPVLWLSGCDKLMAPGATAACWVSQQHWRMFT